MVKESQTTTSEEELKKIKGSRSFKRSIQQRTATLMKSAKMLGIRCGAQVFLVIIGPTGNVEVWPENPAEAASIITKYKQDSKKPKKHKQGRKKPKPCREVEQSNTVESSEENKAIALVDDDLDIDQFLNDTVEIFEENNGFHMDDEELDNFDIDRFMSYIEENEDFVKHDEGLGNVGNHQYLSFEENKGFENGYSLDDVGMDNMSEQQPLKVDLESNIESVYEVQPLLVCNDLERQTMEYNKDFFPNEGSDIDKLFENNVLIDHGFDQFLRDFFSGTDNVNSNIPESSTKKSQMVTASAGFEFPQQNDRCGMWPSELSSPTPQYSGFDAEDITCNMLDYLPRPKNYDHRNN